MDAKERKKRIIICVCLALVGVFAAILISSASCRSTFSAGGTGECLSITFFEKHKIKKIDKVVLTDTTNGENKVVIITDTELIREIVVETAVADRANLGCGKTDRRRIDLYHGDKCIRTMMWSDTSERMVNVYNSDLTHWLITPPFMFLNNDGWVELSVELDQKLTALINAA